jgi:hypothetical protein
MIDMRIRINPHAGDITPPSDKYKEISNKSIEKRKKVFESGRNGSFCFVMGLCTFRDI